MTLQPECFVLWFAHRPPQMFWCSDRSDVIVAVSGALATMKRDVKPQYVQDGAEYTDYMVANCMDEGSASTAMLRALPCMQNVAVFVPVTKHRSTGTAPADSDSKGVDNGHAVIGDAHGEEERKQHDAPDNTLVARVVALSNTHIMELTPACDRMLFCRELATVESISCPGVADVLTVTFRTDGLTKRYRTAECVGYAPLWDGGMRFLTAADVQGTIQSSGDDDAALPKYSRHIPVPFTAAAMADLLASHIISSARALCNPVDLLASPIASTRYLNGTRTVSDPELQKLYMSDLADLALFPRVGDEDSPHEHDTEGLVRSKAFGMAESVLAHVVANVPCYRTAKFVKGSVVATLAILETTLHHIHTVLYILRAFHCYLLTCF